MGRSYECEICDQEFDDNRLYRQHRIQHIKQRDWLTAKTSKRAIYRDDIVTSSSVQNSPASLQTSPSVGSSGSPPSDRTEREQTADQSVVTEGEPESISRVEPEIVTCDSPNLSKNRNETQSEKSKSKKNDLGDNSEPKTTRLSSRDRFKCDYCGYHGTPDGMIKHVKAVHPEKYDKWRSKQSQVLSIRCASCDWFFASLDDLSFHQRVTHPINKLGLEVLKSTSDENRAKKNEKIPKTEKTPKVEKIPKIEKVPEDDKNTTEKTEKKTRSSLLKLCSEMKRQAETELEPQREKKKIHISDSFGKLIIQTPSVAKLEAYFAGTVTECPYYNDGVKCDYVGKTNQLLELHVSHKHTSVWDHYMRSIDKPYECDVCNWRYGSLQQLKKHKIKYAKICGSFPQTLSEEYLSKISREMLFVESDSEITLVENPTRGFIIDDVIRADETKCPYEKYFQCKYNFKSNLLLERHINNCHPEKYTEFMTIVDRRLQCESCDFRFDDLTRLRLHKKQKEGVCESYDITNEELYYRKQNFIYANPAPNKSNLTIKSENSELDSNENQVQLPSRDEGMVTSWLKNEVDEVVDEADEGNIDDDEESESHSEVDLKINNWDFKLKVKTISPVFKCEFCPEQFNIDRDKSATFKLVEHVAKEHPVENFIFRTKPTSLLPYQCSICSYCFVDQGSLEVHKMATCSPLIQYNCCCCDMIIYQPTLELLAKQVKTHFKQNHPNRFSLLRTTKSNLYSVECPCCGIYFINQDNLRRHQKKTKCS